MNARRAHRMLELVFYTEAGHVNLENPDTDEVVWSSDDDDDFRDEFTDELLTEKDSSRVMEYLLDAGEMTEDEAEYLEIFEDDGPDDIEAAGTDADTDDALVGEYPPHGET